MKLDDIIILIAVVGGIIGAIMEKVGKAKKAAPKGQPDADAVARRRREQLQELTGTTGQPENLQAGEFEERKRARAAYEARAGEMRLGQSEGMVAERTRMERARQSQQSSDDRRPDQLAKLGGRTQKKRRRQVPRLEPTPPPIQQVEPAQEHGEHLGEGVASRRLGSLDLGRGATEVDTYHVPGDQTMDHVHRHVPDAPVLEAPAAGAVAGKSRLLTAMQGRSWRDVILLKEVLDPPLSERRGQG